ncbi:MAG: RDD family protein [Nitrospirota bacterium]
MLIEQTERMDTNIEAAHLQAGLLNRFIAKFLDFLVVALLYEIPLHISFPIGIVYLLLSDGFLEGSLGKRLIGLKVVSKDAQQAISFRESIIRNIPFAIAYLAYTIPFIGWFIAAGIVLFESFIMIGNPKSVRLGDELAKTFVLDLRARWPKTAK